MKKLDRSLIERTCTLCKILKPYSEFHWDKRHQIPFSRCKKCYNKKCREYRFTEIYKNNYRDYPSQKAEKKKEVNLRYKTKNSDKYIAQYTLRNAIRDKRLIPKPCEVCGDKKVDGHHWSYAPENRLNVQWLCRKHHLDETWPDRKNI